MKNRTMFGTLIHYTDPHTPPPILSLRFRPRTVLKNIPCLLLSLCRKPTHGTALSVQPMVRNFAEQAAVLLKKSLYDTGVTPVYGQQILTLSTCYGSGKNGRLIVAARKTVTFMGNSSCC